MKRLLTGLMIALVITAFALIPGMDKTKLGGWVGLWPVPLWVGVDGYYMEGFQVYEIPEQNVFVDLYIGPTAGAAFLSLGYVGGFGFDIGAMAEAFVYKSDFNIDIFGYKFIPALEVYAVAYYSFGAVSVYNYSEAAGGFNVYGGLNLALMLQRPESGEWISFYFWPIPLILGVDIVKF